MSEQSDPHSPQEGQQPLSAPTVDVVALRALCEAATPGPWFSVNADDEWAMNCYYVSTDPRDDHNLDVHLSEAEDAAKVVAITLLQQPRLANVGDDRWEKNAAYIAAFNPATATALLNRLAALEAALAHVEKEREAAEGLRAAAQQHLDWVDGAIRERFTAEAQRNAAQIRQALDLYEAARATGETPG